MGIRQKANPRIAYACEDTYLICDMKKVAF